MKSNEIHTGSLFGSDTGAAPAAPAPKPKANVPARRFRNVLDPAGEPDKRGKYAYEKLAERIGEMSESDREITLRLLLDTPYARMEEIAKTLDYFRSMTTPEQDDFAEGMGS